MFCIALSVMSALFGIVRLDAQPISPSELESMRAALAPHGIAGGGIWAHAHIGLGVCLSRLTPQDAFEQQPLVTSNNEIVLVSDARLDNRPELARELGLADVRAMPDSALILRAYEKWNTECAHHCIGDFVLAVWDAPARTLYVARSPFGGRAFFYHATPQTLAFASMPKGLHALPHVPRALDEEYLAD